MDISNQFMSEVVMPLLATAITAIFGYLGVMAKKLINKYVDNKQKQEVAKLVVMGIEQCYKDLHGEEKLNKAIETATIMLSEKGITVTDLEMKMLIEAAVGGFNKVFENPSSTQEEVK